MYFKVYSLDSRLIFYKTLVPHILFVLIESRILLIQFTERRKQWWHHLRLGRHPSLISPLCQARVRGGTQM